MIHNLIKQTKVFNLYVSTTFFACLIFFIFNSHIFTPMEMILYTILGVIFSKSITLLMYSLIIMLDNDLKNRENEMELDRKVTELNLKMNEEIQENLQKKK